MIDRLVIERAQAKLQAARARLILDRPFLGALLLPRLRQKLGELNAEDFYNGPLRRQKADEARSAAQQGSAAAERASEADDEVLDDELDVQIQSSCGRAEPDGDEDDFGF